MSNGLMKVSFVVWASAGLRPVKTNALPTAILGRCGGTRARGYSSTTPYIGFGGPLADIVTARALYRPQYKSAELLPSGMAAASHWRPPCRTEAAHPWIGELATASAYAL
jgi:hypothetical protein